jgi:hypothetical protein
MRGSLPILAVPAPQISQRGGEPFSQDDAGIIDYR